MRSYYKCCAGPTKRVHAEQDGDELRGEEASPAADAPARPLQELRLEDDAVVEVEEIPPSVRTLVVDFYVYNELGGVAALAAKLPAGLVNLTLNCDSGTWRSHSISVLWAVFAAKLVDPQQNFYHTEDGGVGVAAELPAGLVKLELAFLLKEVADAHLAAPAAELPAGLTELTLRLHGTKVGDTGLAALGALLPAGLVDLAVDIQYAGVGDTGVAALAAKLPSGLAKLTLTLHETEVGDTGVAALAPKLPSGLAQLTLDFSWIKVGDTGVAALAAKLPLGLANLSLCLHCTQVGDTGVAALAAKLPLGLAELTVDFRWTTVTQSGKAELKETARARCGDGCKIII